MAPTPSTLSSGRVTARGDEHPCILEHPLLSGELGSEKLQRETQRNPSGSTCWCRAKVSSESLDAGAHLDPET